MRLPASITLPSVNQVKEAAAKVSLKLQSVESFATDADATFIKWYERYRERFYNNQEEELPESFRRTWEFYLLHRAACFRVCTLQPYQMLFKKI